MREVMECEHPRWVCNSASALLGPGPVPSLLFWQSFFAQTHLAAYLSEARRNRKVNGGERCVGKTPEVRSGTL
jgi:hypothetical protein